MSKKLTVTGTGDALFVAQFPEYYNGQKKQITDFINKHDIKITNLETNLSDYGDFANAYSGGTWINTPKEYFDHLKSMGFNFYGNANNHCMDYSYHGMLSTIEELDKHGVAHAGTGKDLAQAEKPAIIEIDGKKIAIFAIDASFEVASKAGRATDNFIGRPGVNYLRHSTAYKVTEEQMQSLKEIAKYTKINYNRDFNIATGYVTPDPEGVFVLGKTTFTTKQDAPKTACNPKDKQRHVDLIKQAKKENDYIFVQIHCHDDDDVSHANPPEYLIEFCKACIDAGASAIFGGGCHELRGIEIYKGKPIMYSLGDFIYQGPRVEKLPADFMEQYGVDINATAEHALDVRSRGGKVGLHLNKENYLTVLPSLSFEGDELVDIKLLPVGLNFDKKDLTNGLPMVAGQEEQKEILSVLNRLSKPFGTQFELKDGLIIIKN
ncbi:MAG: CapA family protein [Clostridia bacterium]|nr:CapA family protein [Clostridia bacterium]